MKAKSSPPKIPSSKGVSAKDRILAAGIKLFARQSYEQVAIDDIAKEAGVAHGLVFHYFKSKLDLFVQVYHVDRDEMQRRRAAFTRDGTPDQRLRRFVQFHMRHLREWPRSHFQLLRGGAPAKLMAEAEVARMAGVREVLGYFSSESPTEQELILGRAWLSCQGEILLAWLQAQNGNDKNVMEACVELFYEIVNRAPLLCSARGKEKTIMSKMQRAIERERRRISAGKYEA